MDRIFKHPFVAFLLIALLTCGAYATVFHHDFVEWDDPVLVTQNPFVLEFSGKIFTTYDPELYIPLTLLTYQIEHAIVGLKPFLFHLDNLIIHILNACFVTMLLQRFTKRRVLAVLGGLIFAVHPLNVEAVAWISGRKESLMTFFFLASLLAALRSYRPWDKWHVGSIILFMCSLLSKVTGIGLPLLLLFLDVRDGDSFVDSLKKRWPYFLLAIIFGIVALFGKQDIAGLERLSFLILLPQSIVFYIQKLLLPINLAPFYSAPELSVSFRFFVSCVVLIIIAVIGWFLRRKQNVLFGLLFFFITLGPSLFAYAKTNQITLAADRYAYLASVGWILFIGSILLLLPTVGRKIAAGIAVGVILVFLPLTYTQAAVWQSTQTLFLHLIKVDPDSGIARNNLGLLLIRDNRLDDALKLIDDALARNPSYVDALINRGVIMGRKGNLNDAEAALKKAVALNPESTQAHFNLGGVYFVRGQWALAEAQYNETLRINPYHQDAERQLEAVMRRKIGGS